MNVVEFSYYLGRWAEARELLPPQSRRRFGNQLFVWRMSRAVLALGEGDLDTARVDLDGMELPAHESTEPQFVGAYGWMRAELERRSGNIDAGPSGRRRRARPDRVLLGRRGPHRGRGRRSGVRVEADAATLARDRRDAEAEQVALQPRRGAASIGCG